MKRSNNRNIYTFLDKIKHIFPSVWLSAALFNSYALLNLTEAIMKGLDNGNSAYGVFVELQKGFPTVDRSILLRKLCH